MRYLTPEQLKLLKLIRNSGTYDCVNLSPEKLNIIKFLRSEGFLDAKVTYRVFPNGSEQLSSVETGIASVQISEAGKAYFAELAVDRIRYRIPLAVSVLALLISGMALYASTFPQETKIINTITISTSSNAITK